MDPGFDKNRALVDGYQAWCDTEPAEWEGNIVGRLLAEDAKIVDVELGEEATGKAAVLDKLTRLKETTTVDPLSVRVGTAHDGSESFACDWERMEDEQRERGGWHTCFDRFEWTGDKISAIYVCPADDHSLRSSAHH